MGTYMDTGLIIKFTVEKSNLEFFDNGLEDVKKELESQYYYNLDLYEQSEIDSFYVFELKSEVIENGLIPFLKEIYPKLYVQASYNKYCKDVLDDLLNLSKEDIVEYSKTQSKIPFQYDKYVNSDYIYGNFGKKVVVKYDSIALYSDGKIIIESTPEQFKFFTYCIVKAYPEHPISSSLKVYISG